MKTLITLLAVLVMTTVAQAVTTTWTGATSSDWHDASNWTAGVPTDGDNVNIPSSSTLTWAAAGGFPTSNQNGKGANIDIDTSGGDVQLQVGWGPWGSASWGTQNAVVNKNGAGTFTQNEAGGWWAGGGATPATTFNLNAGVYRVNQIGEPNNLTSMGALLTFNMNGGEFYYDSGTPFNGHSLFHATADSNLRLTGSAASNRRGWAKPNAGLDVAEIEIDAGATLSVIVPTTFYLDNPLHINVNGNSAGKLDIDGNLVLQNDAALALSGADSALATIVVADYSGGSLTGTFASVTGLPFGTSLDYAHAGGTQIAVVGIIPEPSTLVLAALGLLGLLFFRRRRRK